MKKWRPSERREWATRFAPVKLFITKHSLHRNLPVDLTPVNELYEVKLLPFSGATLGFACGSVIAVNEALHYFQRRMVIAHELAHLLLEHPDSFFLCNLNDWWYNKFEVEAQKAAALILVPWKPLAALVQRGCGIRDLEEHFEVPGQLLELRLKMGHHQTGHPG